MIRHPEREDGHGQFRRRFTGDDQLIAAEVDRRRKSGEGFDRLAREMKVSRRKRDSPANGTSSNIARRMSDS